MYMCGWMHKVFLNWGRVPFMMMLMFGDKEAAASLDGGRRQTTPTAYSLRSIFSLEKRAKSHEVTGDVEMLTVVVAPGEGPPGN